MLLDWGLVAITHQSYIPCMSKRTIHKVQPLGLPWVTQDPFLFCVFHKDGYPKGNAELGPAESIDGRELGQDFDPSEDWRMYHGQSVPGFPAHPHRGFETVTVVNKGIVDHSDSLGAHARYGHGDAQWLTAGKGIQHAEMFPLLDQNKANPLELFQIWLNLPQASKMSEPCFKIFWNDEIPSLQLDSGAVKLRVIAGQYEKHEALTPPPDSWASKEVSDIAIWTIELEPGTKWVLPKVNHGTNRTLYYYEGKGLRVGGVSVPSEHAIELATEDEVEIETSDTGARLLLLQGRPIGESVAQYGPFVMNSREEVQKAFSDYRKTQFGGWPWKSQAPTHGEKSRFAIYPDGHKEER